MKKSIMKKIALTILVLGTTFSFANGPQNGQGRKGTPPEEAIIACEGQSSGDTCSMTTQRGDSLTGTCQNTPDDKYFVCMPEGMKKR